MPDCQRTDRNGAHCDVRKTVPQMSLLLSSSGVRPVRWTHLRKKCPVRCFRCRRVREIRVFGRKRCRVGTYTILEVRLSANASAGRYAARPCPSICQCRRSLYRPLMSKHSCSFAGRCAARPCRSIRAVPQVVVPPACVETYMQCHMADLPPVEKR